MLSDITLIYKIIYEIAEEKQLSSINTFFYDFLIERLVSDTSTDTIISKNFFNSINLEFSIDRLIEQSSYKLITSNKLFSIKHYLDEQELNSYYNILIQIQGEICYTDDKLYKGNALNYEQKQSISLINKKFLTFVSGKAGTGKSMLIKYLIENNNNYIFISFTHSSVNNIKEGKKNDLMMTVHKFNMNKQLDLKNRILIIDESSFLSTQDFLEIFKKYKLFKKIIVFGDHNQLTSINHGKIFKDFCNLGNNLTTLEQNMRTNNLHIIETADYILKEKDISVIEFSKKECHHTELEDMKKCVKCIYLNNYKLILNSLISNKTNSIILAYTNKKVDELNRQIQHIKYTQQKIQPIFQNEKLNLYKDEIVITTKNSTGFYNGQKWVVDGIFQNYLIDKSIKRYNYNNVYSYEEEEEESDEEEIKYRKNNEFLVLKLFVLENDNDEGIVDNKIAISTSIITTTVSLCYCITIHKSQGLQFDNVMIMIDSAYCYNKNVIYTAITRAKERLSIYSCCNLYNLKKEAEKITLFNDIYNKKDLEDVNIIDVEDIKNKYQIWNKLQKINPKTLFTADKLKTIYTNNDCCCNSCGLKLEFGNYFIKKVYKNYFIFCKNC